MHQLFKTLSNVGSSLQTWPHFFFCFFAGKGCGIFVFCAVSACPRVGIALPRMAQQHPGPPLRKGHLLVLKFVREPDGPQVPPPDVGLFLRPVLVEF